MRHGRELVGGEVGRGSVVAGDVERAVLQRGDVDDRHTVDRPDVANRAGVDPGRDTTRKHDVAGPTG